MAEKAENMYEWPDSEGKQVLCHSAHAKRVTSMTLDHTARTYPCRHSGQQKSHCAAADATAAVITLNNAKIHVENA